MITQGKFDALVSLVFNAGCEAVRTSQFIQKLKYRKYKKVNILTPHFFTKVWSFKSYDDNYDSP
jgi:GH24 family phage-related lysozyme (muramidase)